MHLFGKQTQAGDTVACFDVGSSSVTASLIHIDRKDKGCIPRILFTETADMKIGEDLNFELFMVEMDKALATCAQALVHSGLGVPSMIHCFLASPWYAAETRSLKISKDTPFLFSEKIGRSIIETEIERFKGEELIRYKEAGNDVRIIEQHIVQIKINGYEIPKPYGKKVREVEIALFTSLVPENVIEHIMDTMKHVFHSRRVEFHSFIFAHFLVTRDLYHNEPNLLLLDIGGEVTDIALVKNGALSASISFPYGRNFVLRRIASKRHIDFREAQSLFNMYRDGTLEVTLRAELEALFTNVRQEWIEAFQTVLASISHDFLLPDNIILTIDDEYASFFTHLIKKEAFSQYTMTEKEFTVTLLDKKALGSHILFGAKGKAHSFSMIESLALCRV